MKASKPTWKKVIISCFLAIFPWIIPTIIPGLSGAIIFLLFLPTTYLPDDFGTKLNQTNYVFFDLINFTLDFLLFYLIVCTIAYFAGKLKQQDTLQKH